MLKRAATALVLGPLVVWAVWKGPTWLVALLVALVTVGALWEFFGIAKAAGFTAFRLWAIISAAFLIFAQESLTPRWMAFYAASFPVEIPILVFILGVGIFAILSGNDAVKTFAALVVTTAGFLLIAYPLSFLARMPMMVSNGRKLILFTLALVWAGDILGYLVGKGIGKHPMAPVISPKKTWEGAAANFLGSVAIAWPFAKWMWVDPLPLIVVAALANIAGQIGDLVESAYKRSAGVKDSGTILPGHGGILDRVDALIFATPVVWLYVVLWLN